MGTLIRPQASPLTSGGIAGRRTIPPDTVASIWLRGLPRTEHALGTPVARAAQAEVGAEIERSLGGVRIVAQRSGELDVHISTKARHRPDTLGSSLLRSVDVVSQRLGGALATDLDPVIGIGMVAAGDATVAEARRQAQVARAEADRLGSRVLRYSAELDHELRARFATSRAILRAAKRGEFVLYGQPILSAEDERLVSVELLARWDRPGQGLVGPAQFIPHAEEFGLMSTVEDAILTHAGSAASLMRSRCPSVNLNLSAAAISRPGFALRVLEALEARDVDPQRLTVELTESTILVDSQASAANLATLRRAGVSLELDDFGTGFASIGQLHKLPLDGVKLDRSLVSSVADANRLSLVELTIRAGHDLGLWVTAEGVETAEQAHLMKSLGCDRLQGFHFAAPMPLTALARRSTG